MSARHELVVLDGMSARVILSGHDGVGGGPWVTVTFVVSGQKPLEMTLRSTSLAELGRALVAFAEAKGE